MVHYLKCLTEFFDKIESGEKTFEARFNDRDYRVGDVLYLQDWNGWERTGRELTKTVTYILDDSHYCKDGFVIMSIR